MTNSPFFLFAFRYYLFIHSFILRLSSPTLIRWPSMSQIGDVRFFHNGLNHHVIQLLPNCREICGRHFPENKIQFHQTLSRNTTFTLAHSYWKIFRNTKSRRAVNLVVLGLFVKPYILVNARKTNNKLLLRVVDYF